MLRKLFLMAMLSLVSYPASAKLTVGFENQVRFDYRGPAPEYRNDPPISTVENELNFGGLQFVTTQCIAKKVYDDTRRSKVVVKPTTDLMVEAIEPCMPRIRGLIDAFDEMWGKGGEEFFIGPYLDALPSAVMQLIKKWNH